LPGALHGAEHENADGAVEQHLAFMLPHELGGLAPGRLTLIALPDGGINAAFTSLGDIDP
jgi:hypothetical protein